MRAVAAVGWLCVVCLGCSRGGAAALDRSSLVDALRDVTGERSFQPRFSTDVRYRTCAGSAPEGRALRITCVDPPPLDLRRISRVSVAAAKALRDSVRSDPLQALGLAELLTADSSALALQHSIAHLEQAARLSTGSGDVLSDLAGALLVRAELRHSARDVVAAADVAADAVARAPQSPNARFNLAVALEMLGLRDRAAAAWSGYLAVDSTSAWADEARERRRRAEAIVVAKLPSPRASDSLRAFARAFPQEAREIAWDSLLAVWGTAHSARDTSTARVALSAARRIALALREDSRDQTLYDAVRTIDSTTAPSSLARLARAHTAFGRAEREYGRPNYGPAARSFAEAARDGSQSETVVLWARAFAAMAIANDGGRERGAEDLRRVNQSIDAARFPALAGRARWMLATTLFRMGRIADAVDLATSARELLARAGEQEHVAFTDGLLMQAASALGRSAPMYDHLVASLTGFANYRSSKWLHSMLNTASRLVAEDGYGRAAMYMEDEDVQVTLGDGRAFPRAEALVTRATLRVERGETAHIGGDIDLAHALLPGIPSPTMRRWMSADLALLLSQRSLVPDAATGVRRLDSVVAFFGSPPYPARLVPALVARSDQRLRLGDTSRGREDLNRAIDLIARERESAKGLALRASIVAGARAAVDRFITLDVAAGRTDEALLGLERGRVTRARSASRRGRSWTAPRGTAVLDLAVIGDTLFTWRIVDSTVSFAKSAMDRAAIDRALATTRTAVEMRSRSTAFDASLEFLYDALLGRALAGLPESVTRLVLVVDGELVAVPFAALRSRANKHYLVERYTIRLAPSLDDAITERHWHAQAQRLLLVGDPAFDVASFPALPRLPGALAEVRGIARDAGSATVLTGPGATPPAMTRLLHEATVLHFAGHAVLDDERPEHSMLVLARDDTRGDAARLTASTIANLDLRALRLVILSACETVGPLPGHSSAFSDLAGAFLAAGAGGVIASPWPVDDRGGQAFMIELHRQLRTEPDPAAALRATQIALLRSGDPALRLPSLWAAFRYTGH